MAESAMSWSCARRGRELELELELVVGSPTGMSGEDELVKLYRSGLGSEVDRSRNLVYA
jgi:hypothetical protein